MIRHPIAGERGPFAMSPFVHTHLRYNAPMAGYSGTPLAKKLGIKECSAVALIDAPQHFAATLEPLPAGVHFETLDTGNLDVILFFSVSAGELSQRWGELMRALQPAGGLWIAWPKKASKVPTDITEDTLRTIGLPTGMVDNKVCAVDETWSGLRFVYRRENRPRP